MLFRLHFQSLRDDTLLGASHLSPTQSHLGSNTTRQAITMDETVSPSVPSPPDATYGFIGLGNMGYGMAKNVREKIPSSSKLIVCELNTAQRDKFVKEIEGDIETAETPKEIGEKCVCMSFLEIS